MWDFEFVAQWCQFLISSAGHRGQGSCDQSAFVWFEQDFQSLLLFCGLASQAVLLSFFSLSVVSRWWIVISSPSAKAKCRTIRQDIALGSTFPIWCNRQMWRKSEWHESKINLTLDEILPIHHLKLLVLPQTHIPIDSDGFWLLMLDFSHPFMRPLLDSSLDKVWWSVYHTQWYT